MEGARRLFTTVTPSATTPAAEELVKRDQHSSECCLKIGWLSLRIVLASRRMLANIAKIIRVPPQLDEGRTPPREYKAFMRDPLSVWIESTFGVAGERGPGVSSGPGPRASPARKAPPGSSPV
jgi:hypothetical protein